MGQRVRGANGVAQPHRRAQLAAIPTAPLTALIVPTGTWGLRGSRRFLLSAQRGSQELSWDVVCSRNTPPWLAACTGVWMLSRDPGAGRAGGKLLHPRAFPAGKGDPEKGGFWHGLLGVCRLFQAGFSHLIDQMFLAWIKSQTMGPEGTRGKAGSPSRRLQARLKQPQVFGLS